MLAMRKHSLAYHYCTSQVAHSRATGMMPGRGVGGPLDGALMSHNMIRCLHPTPQRYHRVVVNKQDITTTCAEGFVGSSIRYLLYRWRSWEGDGLPNS
jgi:hypothetical protein